MGWKELNKKKLENILHLCEERVADLSLLKSVEPSRSSDQEDDTGDMPTFVCELQRDSAVLDMLALCKIFQLSVQVFSQSVGIFDRFLSVIKVRPKFLNCISLSCIYLALQLQQSSQGADFGPPGASDINRFISASESRCTYSDVVRMSGVIAKKLCLDIEDIYPTLYDVLIELNEGLKFGSLGAMIDFYATCLCSHDIVVESPRSLLLAIVGQFTKSDLITKLKSEIGLDCQQEYDKCTAKICNAYNSYLESGKPRKSGKIGVLKKYIFKISQRTGQALMISKSRILALASANKLAPIQEESSNTVEVDPSTQCIDGSLGKVYCGKESQAIDIDEAGPPMKKKRKTQKYSKVPLWFGFSNHATARASKPYYQHLVSSWSPWNSAPDHELNSGKSHDKRQLLSVFLIN